MAKLSIYVLFRNSVVGTHVLFLTLQTGEMVFDTSKGNFCFILTRKLDQATLKMGAFNFQ